MEADFRQLLKCCFFHNWPNKGSVDWWNLPNFPFSIIEIIEIKEKWQFFASEWQISIIVEDQIRLWRLYFCAWINRRGDTAIRYFRVVHGFYCPILESIVQTYIVYYVLSISRSKFQIHRVPFCDVESKWPIFILRSLW